MFRLSSSVKVLNQQNECRRPEWGGLRGKSAALLSDGSVPVATRKESLAHGLPLDSSAREETVDSLMFRALPPVLGANGCPMATKTASLLDLARPLQLVRRGDRATRDLRRLAVLYLVRLN
jgi:hypothetical protein